MDADLLPVPKHRYDPGREPVRWGYIDRRGKVVIDYRFDWASRFRDGIARVILDGRATFIDGSGAPLLRARYEKVGTFGEGRGAVSRDQKWGYVGADGALAIDLRFEEGRAFAEGLAAVRLEDKWGYIDASGAAVIPPRFDEAASFAEGLAAVRIGSQWSFCDRAGDLIVEPRFAIARPFSGGLAAVQVNGKFGYADRDCAMRIVPQFDFATEFHEELACVGTQQGPWAASTLWHFIGPDGERATPLELHDVSGTRFSEGLAPIRRGDHTVYCDRTGATRIEEARFTSKDGKSATLRQMTGAGDFRGGIAEVTLRPSYYVDPTKALGPDHLAYIDGEGEVVWGDLR